MKLLKTQQVAAWRKRFFLSVLLMDLSKPTDNVYLTLLLKSYQDKIATLKDELKENKTLCMDPR